MLFGRREQRFCAQQRAHTVGAHFGRRVQPAKGPDPGKAGGQGVLQEAAHELQGFQFDGSKLTGFALLVGLVRSRSLGLRPAPLRILFGASQAPQIFVDVQTDIMHFFVHGCLVSFIDDESGTPRASHLADRSPPGDNPRNYTGIKHPLDSLVKP